MKFQKELEEAKKIARLSGEIMLRYFDADQNTKFKDDDTPVTKADVLVNELVIERLNKAFPEDGIVGEEKSTTKLSKNRIWICDPIDGTIGYVWGTPTAMFSLALVIDGKPVVGVTYDPFLDRLYEGVVGQGSFCNGVRLQVSNKKLYRGQIAVTSNIEKLKSHTYISKLQEAGAFMPVFSGAIYKSCLVAKGKFEGYIETAVGNHDMAAVQVLIEEAGGKVTGLKGEDLYYDLPFKGAVVSNELVHDELVKMLEDYKVIQ